MGNLGDTEYPQRGAQWPPVGPLSLNVLNPLMGRLVPPHTAYYKLHRDLNNALRAKFHGNSGELYGTAPIHSFCLF